MVFREYDRLAWTLATDMQVVMVVMIIDCILFWISQLRWVLFEGQDHLLYSSFFGTDFLNKIAMCWTLKGEKMVW